MPADGILVHKEGFQIGNLNKLDGWNVSIGYQNEVLGGGEDNLISGRGNVSFTWNSNINGNENIAGCFDFNGEITPVKYNSTSVVIKKSDVSEIPTVGSYFFVKWEDIGSFHISEVLEFVNNGTPCYELVFDNNTISEESLIYLNNYIQYRGIIVIYKPYAFDDYFAGCFTEGSKNACLAYGGHVEGFCNKVLNNFAHSEGTENVASGYASHTEGYFNQATGDYSHSEGTENSSTGVASHTEGYFNQATGNYSHAEGWGNIASNRSEHACGSYNVSTNSNNTAKATQFSIGLATGESNRKNGIEVKINCDG